MRKIKGILQGCERDFVLFLLSGVFLGVAQSVDGSTLANYLKEHFGMLILQRSALEFPRELPGLLVVLVIGALSFLGGDVRISIAARSWADNVNPIASFRKAAISSFVKRNWSARISISWLRTRRRESGRGGSVRERSARCI